LAMIDPSTCPRRCTCILSLASPAHPARSRRNIETARESRPVRLLAGDWESAPVPEARTLPVMSGWRQQAHARSLRRKASPNTRRQLRWVSRRTRSERPVGQGSADNQTTLCPPRMYKSYNLTLDFAESDNSKETRFVRPSARRSTPVTRPGCSITLQFEYPPGPKLSFIGSARAWTRMCACVGESSNKLDRLSRSVHVSQTTSPPAR
jgi:hypothetical protein